ncbi:hypothetical protein [Paenibacillus sp. JJ1722]|uniref:hypothetical protein n=1 Tax=Paenibacillus sp. JJ1722 TaxID=3398770 RepID=UPI003AAC3478
MVKTSLDFYKKEQSKSYLLPANRREIQKQIYDLTVKYNELRYQNSEKWIDKETSKMEMAGQSQIAILKMEYDAYMRMSKAKDRTAEQSFELQQKIYEKRKALEDEFLSDFQKRINYQKSMEAVSVSDQLNLWTKMQALYKEGSEQRMEIDVQVHDLKKQLLEDQKKVAAEAAKKEKEALEKTRDEEVKRIEAERDAFIEAQDAKIKAIDDLLAKMQTANEDEDYDRAMAEKQARLALLQSAVGPEGIAERKQTEKDIEDMQREHNRTLAKRGLEDQKKKIQDEKTEREKDYNDQIEAAKQHYDELTSKFDEYSDGVESKFEDLKNTQISKESEKNAEILRQLDQFILDYQMKMAEINATSISASLDTGSSFSQKDSDLERYNSNIDKWYSAGTAEKAKLHEENAALRNKYGIKKDTGKLQKFHSGGIVQGDRGAEVPVIARAGEMYLNDQQQSNLFNLISFKMPRLDFSMPSFSMASGDGTNPQYNNNYYTVTSGDTYIEDESAAKVFWTERDNLVRRLQARGGKS